MDSFHGEVVNKLSTAVAENQSQRKKHDELLKFNKTLEAQCQFACGEWQKSRKEIEDMKTQLELSRKQRDEALQECNDVMAGRSKAIKDKQRMYEERNTALHEYQLIMSERDTVHKEIERLQEDLHNIQKKNETYEKEHKQTVEELEGLRRELASSLLDRDMALKHCNDLKRKLEKIEISDNREYYSNDSHSSPVSLKNCDFKTLKNLQTSEVYSTDAKNNRSSSNTLQKSGENSNLNSATNKDVLSESLTIENEGLRRDFDRLQIDHKEALHEVEVCKKRRDWAFAERDKIVLERESIRTLCDKLRKERDRKVSDLAEALRESDEIKRQKNEVMKELNEVKEKLESERAAWQQKFNQMSRSQHSKPNCTSQDSAIDLEESGSGPLNKNSRNILTGENFSPDLLYDEFTVKLCRDSLHKEWSLGLKFIDKLYDSNVNAIILDSVPVNVRYVSLNNKQFKLCVGDHIMSINHVTLSNLLSQCSLPGHFRAEVESLIAKSGLELEMLVRRYRVLKSFEIVELDRKETFEHDKTLYNSYDFDAEIMLSVIKTKENLNILSIGDKIVELDGHSVNYLLLNNFIKHLMTGSDKRKLSLKVIRSIPNNSFISLAASSTQTDKNNKQIEGFNGEQNTKAGDLSLNLLPELSSVLYSPEEENSSGIGLTSHVKDVLHVNSVDSHDSSDSDDDHDGPTYIGGDNAAEDADDDASTTTVESDDAVVNGSQFGDDGNESKETKIIAQLDRMLEKCAGNDFASISNNQMQNDAELYSDFVKEQTIQPQSPIAVKQPVIRRSNRKKNRSNRCTLGASQLAEVEHELAFERASAAAQSESFGDTWPRYKPQQLGSAVLPSFYLYHGKKLREIYEQQGYKHRTIKDAPFGVVMQQNKKKERKSLGVFADFWKIPEKIESHKATLASSASFHYRNPGVDKNSVMSDLGSAKQKCVVSSGMPKFSPTLGVHQNTKTNPSSADVASVFSEISAPTEICSARNNVGGAAVVGGSVVGNGGTGEVNDSIHSITSNDPRLGR